jgi:hypothetical protein
MSCANIRCERSCEPGKVFCCAPCAHDAGGGRKTTIDRRLLGVFHTFGCEEREEQRQRERATAPAAAAETATETATGGSGTPQLGSALAHGR